MKVSQLRWVALLALVVALGACSRAGVTVNVSGTWTGTFDCRVGCTGGGPMTWDLTQSGTQVTGSVDDAPITSGIIAGSQITVAVDAATNNGPATFTFMGTVEGDTIDGTFEVEFFETATTGTGVFTVSR